jgi:hypothetical protein
MMTRSMFLAATFLLAAAAAQAESLQTPRVVTVTLTTKAGYTATMTLNIHDRKLADSLERRFGGRRIGYVDLQAARIRTVQDVQNYGNGGEWTDYMMMIHIGGLFDWVCAVFGAGVVLTGGVALWIDAANALCIATAIVTGGEAIGKQVYTAYEKSIIDGRAWYWASLLGTCPGVGAVC